jgi:O-methyltransferase involved in polyketide biosynthesis
MMAYAKAAHAWRNHTIGRDHYAVRAVKCDDDSHPRKTLFAFISGYLL